MAADGMAVQHAPIVGMAWHGVSWPTMRQAAEWHDMAWLAIESQAMTQGQALDVAAGMQSA